MLKNMTVSLFLMAFLVCSLQARADEPVFKHVQDTKTLRCGYFLWPPFMRKDPNTGKFSGLNYDVVEAVAKNLGLKVEWTAEVGMGEIVQALNSNKFDMMCTSIWPDPAREFFVTLTKPAAYSVANAFVRADDHRFDGDLSKANSKDIKVSVIDGDFTERMAKERLPEAQLASLPQTASGSELLMQIMTKKADIALIEDSIVNDFAKTNPGILRKVTSIGPIRVYGEHFALRQGEYQMRDLVDLAITQLTNDGVIEQLNDKYAKEYKTHIISPKKSMEQ